MLGEFTCYFMLIRIDRDLNGAIPSPLGDTATISLGHGVHSMDANFRCQKTYGISGLFSKMKASANSKVVGAVHLHHEAMFVPFRSGCRSDA
jgi:hypothetical protein